MLSSGDFRCETKLDRTPGSTWYTVTWGSSCAFLLRTSSLSYWPSSSCAAVAIQLSAFDCLPWNRKINYCPLLALHPCSSCRSLRRPGPIDPVRASTTQDTISLCCNSRVRRLWDLKSCAPHCYAQKSHHQCYRGRVPSLLVLRVGLATTPAS